MKHGVDLYEVGEKLMMEYKDIAWIAVDMKGTGVVVNIVETIPKTQYVDREKPTDVVANADGVIVSVAASSGTPMVKEGDEVKKGDLLISSEVPVSYTHLDVYKRQALDIVDTAVGLNNHMGSAIMEDEKKLDAVMQVLSERNMVFIDSLTTVCLLYTSEYYGFWNLLQKIRFDR